jgi:hypothetical protein
MKKTHLPLMQNAVKRGIQVRNSIYTNVHILILCTHTAASYFKHFIVNSNLYLKCMDSK